MQCKKKNLNQGVSIIYAQEFWLTSFSGIVMNWCWAIRGPLGINCCRQAMPMLKNVIDVMGMYFTYHILKFLERINKQHNVMLLFDSVYSFYSLKLFPDIWGTGNEYEKNSVICNFLIWPKALTLFTLV